MIDLLGIGARTPVGLTAAASAASIRAGISRLREFSFTTMRGEPLIIGTDPRLANALQGPRRMIELATPTLLQALAGIDPGTATECQLWLAAPEHRPGFSDRDAAVITQALVDELRRRGYRCQAVLGGRGHAGVMQCMQRLLTNANPEYLQLVVGVDSFCDDECIIWLEKERRLTQDGVRGGFTPGSRRMPVAGAAATRKPPQAQAARYYLGGRCASRDPAP
ncbi:hypothetical protein [Nannocystis pusilla]|uniref:hypothetical protein n=1 Tax=Nannocystis pusilla TaxID=889268 RepID=UPI003B7C7C4C